MGLLQELAAEYCEKDTNRMGCLRPISGYGGDERCAPCKARAELGIELAPRRCTKCDAEMVEAIEWTEDKWGDPLVVGMGIDGSETCPPPRHHPKTFYNEWRRKS